MLCLSSSFILYIKGFLLQVLLEVLISIDDISLLLFLVIYHLVICYLLVDVVFSHIQEHQHVRVDDLKIAPNLVVPVSE